VSCITEQTVDGDSFGNIEGLDELSDLIDTHRTALNAQRDISADNVQRSTNELLWSVKVDPDAQNALSSMLNDDTLIPTDAMAEALDLFERLKVIISRRVSLFSTAGG